MTNLTRDELVQAVRIHHQASLAAKDAAIEHATIRSQAVHAALKAGTSPSTIASRLGVDRTRIYQMRRAALANTASTPTTIDDAVYAHRAAVTANMQATEHASQRNDAVRVALTAGISAIELGRALNVDRQRIYAMGKTSRNQK